MVNESSLYVLVFHCHRLFLVQASRTGRQEEVRSFFEKMSDSLHDRKEWKDWFGEYIPCGCMLQHAASVCVG